MKLEITPTAKQEAGLIYVTDVSNAERLAKLPDDEKPSFIPETPEEYALRLFGSALDSYASQVVEFKKRDVSEKFTSLKADADKAEVEALIDAKLESQPKALPSVSVASKP